MAMRGHVVVPLAPRAPVNGRDPSRRDGANGTLYLYIDTYLHMTRPREKADRIQLL